MKCHDLKIELWTTLFPKTRTISNFMFFGGLKQNSHELVNFLTEIVFYRTLLTENVFYRTFLGRLFLMYIRLTDDVLMINL